MTSSITLFNSDKTTEIYSAYKYIDIKPEWIIHEGNLEYLYGENIFKSSLFKQYLFVLTCFLNDKKENFVSLYLYSEKTKSPYKYFQLERNDQLNDRCRKLIEGKSGLFFLELIIHKTNKGEIFGARSVPERKLWIEKFHQAKSRSVSDVHSSQYYDQCPFPGILLTLNLIEKKFFYLDDSNRYLQPNSFSIECRSSIEQPIHDYEEVKSEDFDENTKLSWENIFYDNRNNDFIIILSNIGQSGVFLIRPQSKKTSSSDHDYTLCVYDDDHVYKFGIHQSSNHRYRLIYREDEPSFVDIVELCQYYTIHPLRITLKDGFNKSIYLKYPYKNEHLYF